MSKITVGVRVLTIYALNPPPESLITLPSQSMTSALLPYPSLLFPHNSCPQPSCRITHYSSLTIHALSPPAVSLITLPSQFMPSALLPYPSLLFPHNSCPQPSSRIPHYSSLTIHALSPSACFDVSLPEREVCPKTVFTVIVS